MLEQSQRKRTQKLINQMAQSTPQVRIIAAKAKAADTHAKIDFIAAQADLKAVQSSQSCVLCLQVQLQEGLVDR